MGDRSSGGNSMISEEAELQFSRNWAFVDPDIQKKIFSKKILIAGTGLGSVVAHLAVRTGFGSFILADGDIVDLSNLNRQIFRISDIGKNKTHATSEILKSISPQISVETVPYFLTQDNMEQHIADADFVVNTIDWGKNFITCNELAVKHNKIVLSPMNIGWGGCLYIFHPEKTSLAEFLEVSDLYSMSEIELKQKFVKKAIGEDLYPYLEGTMNIFENLPNDNWIADPQLGVATFLSASLTITSLVSLISGKNVPYAPEVIKIDAKALIENR